jgi:long-chain acyl-CoA synthetase
VHAVVVTEPGADPQSVVRQANQALLDHQKIRGISVWPGEELPRTEGTRKLKRQQVRDWVASGSTAPTIPAPGSGVEGLLAQFAHGRAIGGATTLDELGLSSLERVELMVALEERFGRTIDENAFAQSTDIAALERLVRAEPAGAGPDESSTREPLDFPAWNRTWWARGVRRASYPTWLLPLARLFAWVKVSGLEHLARIEGPVIFAANHQSHMDTPAILWALPGRWRYRVAVAMAKEFFKAHFFPEQFTRSERLTNGLNYYLSSLFFNAFPLPQREAGARQTLRYIGDLVTDGWSVLIFPEGKRTAAGEINPFRPGIGMIGAKLHVPVVPVRLEGLEKVLHQKARMATPGRVRVSFGPPIELHGEDYEALTRQVEDAVRGLKAEG